MGIKLEKYFLVMNADNSEPVKPALDFPAGLGLLEEFEGTIPFPTEDAYDRESLGHDLRSEEVWWIPVDISDQMYDWLDGFLLYLWEHK